MEVTKHTSGLLDAEITKLKRTLKLAIKIEAMEKLEGKSAKIDDTYKKDLTIEIEKSHQNLKQIITILTAET
jgi:hypothetical protein